MIHESILRAGADLILWIQAHLAFLYGPMELFTLLGEELFYMILIPMIYWCVHRGTGLRLLGLITCSSYVNDLLKIALHSPRPYWWEPAIQGMRTEAGFCPPSGHSQNAITFWGFLTATGYRARPAAWLWPAFVVLAFCISVSRVVLGVHFPHSVLLGWLAGIVFLIAYWKLTPSLERWFLARNTVTQVGGSLALALILVAGAVIFSAYSERNFFAYNPTRIADAADDHRRGPGNDVVRFAPGFGGQAEFDVWTANAAADQPAKSIDPFNPKGMVSYAAVIGGLGVSVALMLRTASFSVQGTWLTWILRYLLGIVGVFAIYASGKFAPDTLPDWQYLGLRFLRYFAMMLWAIWLAPFVFLKLGLASRAAAEASPE